MGMKHREYLSAPPVDENGHSGSSSSSSSKVFGCHVCKTHLSTSEFIESKVSCWVGLGGAGGERKKLIGSAGWDSEQHFQGQHGKAYLFTEV